MLRRRSAGQASPRCAANDGRDVTLWVQKRPICGGDPVRIRKTIFEGDALTLDVSAFFQALMQCSDKGFVWRTDGEIADYRHRWLLRACHKRPSAGCSCNSCDEFASPHCLP